MTPVRSVVPDTAQTAPRGVTRRKKPTPSGYQLGGVLGRGGMGEVVLARDTKIGREVALKVMNADLASDYHVERFVREAMIQARLEHPAIVPVYEIGRDPDGHAYFTMKRIAGKTLLELIGDRSANDQSLLRALVDASLAIELAHARGVIHRDLKPTNIMLGDFGEVYVLDWGVARVIGDPEDDEFVGTAGYAAPEQVRGEEVGPAADVYSLGAILFEILTRRPLHPRGEAIESTLARPTRAPVTLRARVAPELDAVCVAALAEDPAARPSARGFADALVRYLDGDRDVERRRALAAEHLAVAREALTSGDYERRAEAMRAAGRALALDPESDAAAVVGALMVVRPRQVPPGLAAQVKKVENELSAGGARDRAVALSMYFMFVPFCIWVGVTQPLVVAGMFGFVAAQVVYNLWMQRRGRAPSQWSFIANILLALLLERMFGPFVVMPAIVIAVSGLAARDSDLLDRPWLLVAVAIVAFALPFVLELTGVLAPTWSIEGGALVIRGAATEFVGARAAIYLVAVNLVMIVVCTIYGWRLAVQRRAVQRRFESQAWHLRQLLP